MVEAANSWNFAALVLASAISRTFFGKRRVKGIIGTEESTEKLTKKQIGIQIKNLCTFKRNIFVNSKNITYTQS